MPPTGEFCRQHFSIEDYHVHALMVRGLDHPQASRSVERDSKFALNHPIQRIGQRKGDSLLLPTTCTWRSAVQPTWSTNSKVSIAISEVEYLVNGLSERPTPRLSKTRTEYLGLWSRLVSWLWPKSFVCRCHAEMSPPKPMINWKQDDQRSTHDKTTNRLLIQ